MPLVMLGTAYISSKHGAGIDNPDIIEPPPAIETALLSSRPDEFDYYYQGLDLGSQLHPAYANERLVGTMISSSSSSSVVVDNTHDLTTINNSNSNSTGSSRPQQRRRRRPRQSIFLTTKLSPNEHGYYSTLRAVQRSLRYLRTDTIDLFLIHHPQCLRRCIQFS